MIILFARHVVKTRFKSFSYRQGKEGERRHCGHQIEFGIKDESPSLLKMLPGFSIMIPPEGIIS